ncbi:MAG TPA: ParB/RepB/Spo0J family partition protein [Azospirillaceae bacterium]|nr:ParB/RepB/Spo0J family partition protein [Azospirillaceae bacterium]
MDETKRRTNLGRGLSALFGEAATGIGAPVELGAPATKAAGSGVATPKSTLPIEFLRPGKYQPRRQFDEEALQGLVVSIREKGVLQPLLVRPEGLHRSTYEIIAGERRWRAAQLAGLHEVPAIIRDFSDREALEIALIENLQRQDLTPFEEAEGFRRLLDEFQHTQEELAKVVGKSRSHVANLLRLLALPAAVRLMVEKGDLTAGHARALLTADDPLALAKEVVKRGLNVRQTEALVRAVADEKAKGGRKGAKDPNVLALEQDLTTRIGLKVIINTQGKGGSVNLHYQDLDQLDDLLRRLRGE